MNLKDGTGEGIKTVCTIAVPLARGKLAAHFGHCEEFVLVKVDPQSKRILEVASETPPPHEPGLLPAWLSEKGANLIIAGGMGQRAQQLFAQNNIDVVVGAPVATPEELVQKYLNNELESGQNLCDH